MIDAGCFDRLFCSQEVRLSEGSAVFSVRSVARCTSLVRNVVHESSIDVMVGNGTTEENGALLGPTTVPSPDMLSGPVHRCDRCFQRTTASVNNATWGRVCLFRALSSMLANVKKEPAQVF